MAKVLVIDDDPISLKVCTQFLEPHFQVLMAEDVEKAKALILLHSVDVVISDFYLHESSILGLLSWRNDHAMDIPVIGMSKFSGQEEMREAIDLGLFDFMSKPVDQARLLECIHLALRFDFSQWRRPSMIAFKARRNKAELEVLNLENLLAVFASDSRQLNEILEAFRVELEHKCALLDEMLIAETFEDLHRNLVLITHRLEGSASYIGASELQQTCKEIQNSIVRGELIQHGDVSLLISRIQKLQQHLDLFLRGQGAVASKRID